MFVHHAFARLKKILPRPVSSVLRRVFTALLTPVYFSFDTGHFISSLRARALDKHGQPLPWYTFPAIAFLSSKDTTSYRVLEFGSGQSTLWWAARAHYVLSLENDPVWYEQVKRRSLDNVDVRFVPDADGIALALNGSAGFNIVVVDGLDRVAAAKAAVDVVAPTGAIIVDNSDVSWGPEDTYPIMESLRLLGFQRVDFYGYAPGVILPHCTSLFFKGECDILKGGENPVRFRS